MFHLSKDIPGIILKNIEKSLVEAFTPIGISDWNSIFYMAHPSGLAILDQVHFRFSYSKIFEIIFYIVFRNNSTT